MKWYWVYLIISGLSWPMVSWLLYKLSEISGDLPTEDIGDIFAIVGAALFACLLWPLAIPFGLISLMIFAIQGKDIS